MPPNGSSLSLSGIGIALIAWQPERWGFISAQAELNGPNLNFFPGRRAKKAKYGQSLRLSGIVGVRRTQFS